MPYRCAIIGYGGMGSFHHKNIRERVTEITVTGAYDIQEEVREKIKACGLTAYGALAELLADPSLDLVVIATPNNFHKEIAIQCLRAGKNVICEKPVTMNAAELEEIIAVAQETGKVFSVHQNRRWDKDFCTVKAILGQNLLGSPYYIESRVQGSRRAMHGWRGHKINGGGMIYDWGVHLLDQMMNLIDSPVISVCCHAFCVFSDEVDDNFKVLLRFENGISALIEIATNCFITQPRWHICGKDGTALIEDFACNGKIVQLKTDEEMHWDNEILYTEAGPTRTMAPRPVHTTQEIPLPEVAVDFTDYYRNYAAALDGTQGLEVKPEQALRVMKVIDLLFESAETNKGISCRI